MKSYRTKSTIALVIISVLLVSSLFVPVLASAQSVETENVSLVIMYKDIVSGKVDFLSGANVQLMDYYGNVIGSQVSTPTVTFNNVPVGNYIVNVPSIVIGNYVFKHTVSFVTVTTSGVNSTYVIVPRLSLTKSITLNVDNNGSPVTGAYVSAYIFNTQFFSGYTGSVGNVTFNAPTLPFVVKITTNMNGITENYYLPLNQSTTVDLSSFNHIFGTVEDASNNAIVSTTVYVNIFNNGNIWYTITSNNGVFDFYLYPGSYSIYVTADGYSITSIPSTGGFYPVKLTKVYNYYNNYFTFSNDFRTIYYNQTILLNNKTVLRSLPYSSITILYYQLLYNHMNSTTLKTFFSNSLREYSSQYITVGNYVYSLESYSVGNININYNGFTVQINAIYYNSSVNVSSLLSSQSYIPVYLNVLKNIPYGAQNVYNYTLNIPQGYEISNTVSGITISSYINTVNLTNAQSSKIIELDLKKRVAPQITLSQSTFVIYWPGMSQGNYILNNTAKNFTVLIPANKNVFFNASLAVRDMVRPQEPWSNFTFSWSSEGIVKSGKGLANVSFNFSPGIYYINLTVTDVGKNVNYTNIIVYADGAYPSSTSLISYGKTAILTWSVYYLNSTLYYYYNGTGSTLNIQNGKVVFGPIKVNENQMYTFNVKSISDTLNGYINSHAATNVLWNIAGSKFSGNWVNYTFTYPTRNSYDWVNVTYSDQVGNNVTVSIKVIVHDTVKPVPVIVFQNSTGAQVTNIMQGQVVVLNGTGSYDPQNGTIVSYNWTIKNSSGKVLLNSTNYTIVSGSLNQSVVKIRFNNFGTYYILLNVSDRSGNYNIANRTLRVSPVAPDLIINNVTWTGNFTEGVQGQFRVNVTNTGNANATIYYVSLTANGKVVENITMKNLGVNKTVMVILNWTPPSSGNFTLKFEVYTPEEPTIFLGDNVQSKVVSVNQAAWKLPALIIGIIAIIAIIALVIWRIRKGPKQPKKEKGKEEQKGKLAHKE